MKNSPPLCYNVFCTSKTNSTGGQAMTKEKTQTVIILMLAVVIVAQLYWFFFRGKGTTTTQTTQTATATVSYPGAENFDIHDLALGILRLKNDQYYNLKDEQKAQLLTYLETYQAQQKDQNTCVKEIEKILTKDQLKYLKQNRGAMAGPMLMIDPSKKMSPERQMVQAVIAQLTGAKPTPQPEATLPQGSQPGEPQGAPAQPPAQKGGSTNAQ